MSMSGFNLKPGLATGAGLSTQQRQSVNVLDQSSSQSPSVSPEPGFHGLMGFKDGRPVILAPGRMPNHNTIRNVDSDVDFEEEEKGDDTVDISHVQASMQHA